MTTQQTLYAILDTETHQWMCYNSKIAWTKIGNAKNAYAYHNYYNGSENTFDKQSRYKIVAVNAIMFEGEPQ